MGFPKSVEEQALVACGRCCCICHKFCGTKINLHHIKQKADGGEDTFENCIPLCLDCHEDMGKADPKHSTGKHYSENELIMHRDKWYKEMAVKEIEPISKEFIDDMVSGKFDSIIEKIDEISEKVDIEKVGMIEVPNEAGGNTVYIDTVSNLKKIGDYEITIIDGGNANGWENYIEDRLSEI